ncbi:MAG: hypothetical protein WB760_25725 [Xanthobacteraceae bacterium]
MFEELNFVFTIRHSPTLIFNGVDTQVFCPPVDREDIAKARAGLNLSLDVTVALFVGRFVEKEGISGFGADGARLSGHPFCIRRLGLDRSSR